MPRSSREEDRLPARTDRPQQELARRTLSHVEGLQHKAPKPSNVGINRTPRTAEEIAAVLAVRPPWWEHLYFAGNLLADREAVEAKYLDHDMRYAAPSGERVDDAEVLAYLAHAAQDVLVLVESFKALFEPRVLVGAFGLPGHAGDPQRLRHLAARWTAVYEGMLDWANGLRGASKSSIARPSFETLARLIDAPVEQYRAFVERFASEVDQIPTAVASGAPLAIQLTLTLSIDDQPEAAFTAELEELARRLIG